MRIQIVSCGKPALPYVRDGIAEYRKRMQRFARVEERVLKNAPNPANSDASALRIVLDERGKAMSTRQWADALARFQYEGVKAVSFLIGPADGHTDTMREAAHELWQVAPMTLNHELALLVLWEQIYRVHCVLAGHPYHRD